MASTLSSPLLASYLCLQEELEQHFAASRRRLSAWRTASLISSRSKDGPMSELSTPWRMRDGDFAEQKQSRGDGAVPHPVAKPESLDDLAA